VKRATREWLNYVSAGALAVSHKSARDVLGNDARQRAEIRRLRAFVRDCATYVCACGDGDICVGCAARQTLAPKRGKR